MKENGVLFLTREQHHITAECRTICRCGEANDGYTQLKEYITIEDVRGGFPVDSILTILNSFRKILYFCKQTDAYRRRLSAPTN